MELILYKTLDNSNVVNKTLTDGLVININLKYDTDITKPELYLIGDFRGFNYAHIPELNRYYFIKSIEQLNLKRVRLSLECDVLETYKADFLNVECEYQSKAVSGDYGNIVADSSVSELVTVRSDIVLDDVTSVVLTTLEF